MILKQVLLLELSVRISFLIKKIFFEKNSFQGFPNVGKSSVINSLKRSQACETGSMPGITK
jgi:ribosome biogenesis GTPase A